MSRPVLFDASVIVAGLVQRHPEHVCARSVLEFAAAGLAPIAVACTAPMQVARALAEAGAAEDWAIERAGDVASVFRLLDVSADDVCAALAGPGAHAPDTAVAAAAARRHGVPRVIAEERLLDTLRACGVADVVGVRQADEQLDLLFGE